MGKRLFLGDGDGAETRRVYLVQVLSRLVSKPQIEGNPMARKSVITSKIESEIKLLQRHVTMLKAIMENQPIGIIRLSELLNYPQHKVRYSLRILEQEGLIKPSTEGAVTTDKLQEFLDYLKSMLDGMTSTVQDLRRTLG